MKAEERQEKAGDGHLDRYVVARSAWDERYGDHIQRAAQWRATSLGLIGVCVLGGVALIVQAYRSQFHVYMVATDSMTGRVIAQGTAEQVGGVTETVKKGAMADWVRDLRSVSTDPVFQARVARSVYGRIARGSKADTRITEWYRAGRYDIAQHGTVEVDVNAVLPQTDRTYQVEWTETERDIGTGDIKAKTHWRGMFDTVMNPPKDETTAESNALGLYVVSAQWTVINQEEIKR